MTIHQALYFVKGILPGVAEVDDEVIRWHRDMTPYINKGTDIGDLLTHEITKSKEIILQAIPPTEFEITDQWMSLYECGFDIRKI